MYEQRAIIMMKKSLFETEDSWEVRTRKNGKIQGNART